MSTTTKIEWTDVTLSPWLGCSPVSEGCAHCYLPRQTPLRVGKRAAGRLIDGREHSEFPEVRRG